MHCYGFLTVSNEPSRIFLTVITYNSLTDTVLGLTDTVLGFLMVEHLGASHYEEVI